MYRLGQTNGTRFGLLFLLFITAALAGWGQLETRWLTRAVLPGERTCLYLILPTGKMFNTGSIPNVKGASLRLGNGTFLPWQGSKSGAAYCVPIIITADKPGTITIPPITVTDESGTNMTTTPQSLEVLNFSAVQWKSITIEGQEAPYGVLWHVPDKTPYTNQPVLCELKIYAVANIRSYRVPAIQANGLATWRFEPAWYNRNFEPEGQALINGKEWGVMSFQSALIPLKGGELTCAGNVPAFFYVQRENARFGQMIITPVQVELPLPELTLQAKPLPEDAPAGFHNAVGTFEITTSTDALDLSANEPLSLKIQIKGTGNIDTIAPPTMKDTGKWKIFPANRLTPSSLRTTEGVVEFQQLIRPNQETSEIPSFELVFFDPVSEQFHVAKTKPIPLPWKITNSPMGSATSSHPLHADPPPAGSIPVEEMGDIYGAIPANTLSSFSMPHWRWFLILFLPGVIILSRAWVKHWKQRRESTAEARARMTEFKRISPTTGQAEFLRALGSFIEFHLPATARTSKINHILEERDNKAFSPTTTAEEISTSHKKEMLRLVQKVLHALPLLLLALCLLFFTTTAQAQSQNDTTTLELLEKGEFSQTLQKAESEILAAASPRDKAFLYYCQGVANYRVGKPGEAALSFQRALTLVPGFTEADKNLGFIQRKEGAIPPNISSKQWLVWTPYHFLPYIIVIAGALAFIFLARLLTRSRKSAPLSIGGGVFALILVAAALNYIFYPSTPSNTPPDELLIVTQATPARQGASIDSATSMTLPASTPILLVAERGSWYYVHTFAGTHCWIHATDAKIVNQ